MLNKAFSFSRNVYQQKTPRQPQWVMAPVLLTGIVLLLPAMIYILIVSGISLGIYLLLSTINNLCSGTSKPATSSEPFRKNVRVRQSDS